ncbi:hypothetical protein EXM22_15710 [Oceanispirochaeta crateris]|uniref:RecBCD enzyme subunit RecB n=1 Tax=Oceanispirochaeta crateris TaxID=2518645 RepID=A0A5C1QTK9_9SPIO|nr:hypothetical protein EXM22_15710 [Oceanispirochaeta crateris]
MKKEKKVADKTFDPSKADLLKSIRLEASAGTGKTYNLERVVCELISRYGIPVESILVVTFTNKAARELRDRIRTLVTQRASETDEGDPEGFQRLKDAKKDFDRASIYTIHGFCQHVLKTWPFESSSSFSQEFLTDHSLMEEGVEDVLYREFRRIPDSKKDMIRSFFSGGLEDGVEGLVRDVVHLMEEEDVISIPSEYQMRLVREETAAFAEKRGGIRQALEALIPFAPTEERIKIILKEMNTGQRPPTPANIAGVWESLPPGDSLFEWLGNFFDSKKNQAKYLWLLCEDTLVEKSKNGKSLAALSNQDDVDLIRCVNDLFEALEPLMVPGRTDQTIYFKTLSYGYINEVISAARPIIEEKKALRGARDFSDLIRVLSDLLEEAPDGPLARAIRRQYRVVLVDEFQDTDRRQWSIFQTLFDRPDHNFFLIGDPKQSIYGFRGADLTVYFNACDSVDEERRYSLSTNYRSRRSLVEACNFLFSRLFALKVPGFREVPFEEVDAGNDQACIPVLADGSTAAAVQLCEIELEIEKPLARKDDLKDAWMNRAVLEIENILSGSITLNQGEQSAPISPGDIAILMEKNQDCETMQALLGRQGISAVIFSERKIMETEEASVFGLILRALAHPGGSSAPGALLLSPVFARTTAELQEIRQSEDYEQYLLFLRDAQMLCDQGQLIKVFRQFFEEEIPLPFMKGEKSWRNRLLGESRGKRSCTNLTHLAELFHFEQRQRGLDTRELYDFFLAQLHDPTGDEERQVRLDQDGQAVQILTHHSSKGLEFPIVFFFGAMSNGTMPNPSSLSYSWEDKRYRDFLVTRESIQKAALSDWEERKRLYYVSLTRASALLYMPWFPQSDFYYLTSIYATLAGEALFEEEDELLSCSTLQEMWPFHSHCAFLKSSKNAGDLKKQMNERIGTGLRSLTESRPDLFAFSKELPSLLPEKQRDNQKTDQGPVGLKAAELRSSVPFSRRIIPVVSFSSLTSSGHEDFTPRDDQDRDSQEESIDSEILAGALGLTRGAVFGNLVHCILEEIDYSLASSSLEEWLETGLFGPSEAMAFLEERTLRFFDQTWWKENGSVLSRMIHDVLNCPLSEVGPLKELSSSQRKHELEFLLSTEKGSSINKDDWSVMLQKGYLKGFIDLIFEKNGKLYIADWKTTVPPGKGTLSDYSPDNLKKTMDLHRYDLQAWIYAFALRRYMLSIDPGFSYERDFGGIYYFFVRGMGADGNTGVSFQRPREEDVLNLLKGSEG